MKKVLFHRVLPLVAVLTLLFAVGCGKSPVKDAGQGTQAEPTEIGVEPEVDAASVDHSSLYAVDAETETSDGETFASDTANVNAILVQNAGVLTMASADINKTGDSSGDFSGGQNAAVAVLTKGQMTLNESNITTNAIGAFGMIVAGEGSVLNADKNYLSTSADSSPALVVKDGGALHYTNGNLTTEGAESPCILFSGGSVSLAKETIFAKNSVLVRVLSGENELSLDSMSLDDSPAIAEGATLTLRLQNGASFTGALGSTTPATSNVYLDATSVLTLTGETYLGIYVNADTTHANIKSNGFNLYYDSNAPENAYLDGQSFLLPGGGFLAPII